MHEHDRIVGVERLHDRIEMGIPQELLAVACEQADAMVLERAERMIDLGNRLAQVPHRHHRERTEALGPARAKLARILVAAPRQRGGLGGIAELHARLRERGQRELDAILVHQLERALGRPLGVAADRGPGTGRVNGVLVERRDEMEVDVDAAGGRHQGLTVCRVR